jgi:hypothetical protein
MMAELKRKEDQLTTADLAGRTDEQNRMAHEAHEAEDPDRPKLVKSEKSDPRDKQAASPVMDKPTTAGMDKQTASPIMMERSAQAGTSTALFSENDVVQLRASWGNVQAGFVDEPRRAVEEADKLVASVMKRLAEGFANERSTLEKQWDRGDNVSTEDLRVALQRYRSFFDRLLNA